MDPLSPHIALDILAEANAFPLYQSDEAITHILARVRSLFDASNYVAGFLTRELPHRPDDPLLGWHIQADFAHYYRPQYRTFEKEWFERVAEPGFDPSAFAHLDGMGRDRAYLFSEVCGGKSPLEVGAGHLYRKGEVGDRLFCICPLTDRLELFMTFDHLPGDPLFTEADRDFAFFLLPSMRIFFVRSALSYGHIKATKPLTARERDTLFGLLRGLSEQEIANELSIAYSSVHHYVVSIYRKFNISSRARLTALWFDPFSVIASPQED